MITKVCAMNTLVVIFPEIMISYICVVQSRWSYGVSLTVNTMEGIIGGEPDVVDGLDVRLVMASNAAPLLAGTRGYGYTS